MNSLTKEQKTGFVLLFIFALLTIAMGVLQMRNNIYNPYVLKSDKKTATAQAVVVDETAKLQAIDTDQDGLNNYEELFFYQTSPYLPDTDSDGLKDREEVVAGKDPLCPEGKKCEDAAEATGLSTSSTLNLPAGSADLEGSTPVLPATSAPLPNEANAALEQIVNDPEALRQLLLQSGQVTSEQLQSIDDVTLLNLVKQLFPTSTSTP